MKTITATLPAWLPDHVDASVLQMNSERIASNLFFCDTEMSGSGWTRVGKADITIRLVGEDELVQGQIAALEKQRTAVLAEAQEKCNYINDRISKLQALTFDASGVAA